MAQLPSAQMSDRFNPTSQHDVQRHLGRCLLRLQQYEHLLKSVLGHHRLGGPVEELKTLKAENLRRYANKTLGQLVEVLFDTYLVAEGDERPVLDDPKLPPNGIAVSLQFQMQMDKVRLAQVKAAVEELVSLRNDLVHHFIERFAIWTNAGCEAALGYLDVCYASIDRHYLELCEWAKHMEEARSKAAEFTHSPAFYDMVVNGIAPDGKVDWAGAGIVRALEEALRKNAADGWLRLEDAKSWMARHYPEQTPERYTCRTWPQVLHVSRAFQLEYREEVSGKVAWFRARG